MAPFRIHLLGCLFFTIQLLHPLQAFPTGAGSCPQGVPAVGSGHLSAATIKNGTLEEGNVDVTLDGDRLSPARDFYFVLANVPTEIVVRADYGGSGIKGFLIRLGHGNKESEDTRKSSGIDLSNALFPLSEDADDDLSFVMPHNTTNSNAIDLENLKIQLEPNFCSLQNAVGLTHTSAEAKYLVKGLLELDDVIDDDLVLDITVVMQNSVELSEFYHSQYRLKSRATDAPTPTPVEDTGPQIYTISDLGSSSGAMSATTATTKTAISALLLTAIFGVLN